MNIEEEIFKKSKPNIQLLLKYGFKKDREGYLYSKVFMDHFEARIMVYSDGKVKGKIYDLKTSEEYINYRIEKQVGEFVSSIRESYKDILKDIEKKCFTKQYFVSNQANRITKLVIKEYGNIPEFPWDEDSVDGIFRNPYNQKWYGLIMNIDYTKIDDLKNGRIDVLNVKIDDLKIPDLIKKEGIYPAYHMNKKYWVTIALDDTLSDDEVMAYLHESHKFTEVTKEWLIPANPKYYDIDDALKKSKDQTINWKQSNNIKVGDQVYIYVASPISKIKYSCKVLETDIPYHYEDDNVTMERVMTLKVERIFDDELNKDILSKYNIKSVRGPRSVPSSLKEYLHRLEK